MTKPKKYHILITCYSNAELDTNKAILPLIKRHVWASLSQHLRITKQNYEDLKLQVTSIKEVLE